MEIEEDLDAAKMQAQLICQKNRAILSLLLLSFEIVS